MNEINDIFEKLKAQAQAYITNMLGVKQEHLQTSAYNCGAIVRSGETSDAKQLLQLLLIYATSSMSLRAISICAYLGDSVNVSDEAWRQRFLKCIAWIYYLLQISLDSIAPTALWFSHDGSNMQVYLIDATVFKQEGPNGKELSVHLCYNLTKGAMEEVMVSDRRTAESVKHFTVIPGSLYICDAGYGTGTNIEYIVENKGYALFRITPNTVRLSSDCHGKVVIDMAQKLKTRKKQVVIDCFVHTAKGRYLPVRVIASRLPEDKALLAKERKIREAKKKQRKLKASTLVFCQWVILMTTADATHSTDSLLYLYRSRWQIELLFKRIKQFFDVKRLKKASFAHSELIVLLLLLTWSAVEKRALEVEIFLLQKNHDLQGYSPWVMSTLFFHQFETLLNLSWAADFSRLPCISMVYKLLRNHKSQRPNQYFIFHLQPLVLA